MYLEFSRGIKMLQISIFCVVCCLVNVIFALDLPPYIKPCSIKDPEEFNKCLVKHGNEAIPNMIKGDKKFKIPPLDPLKIERVNFNAGPQLSINVKNVEVSGLKDLEVKSGRLELENGKIIFQVFLPYMGIVGDYVAKGRILVLPLEGNGKMTMELYRVVLNYTLEFENMSFDSTKLLKLKGTDVSFIQEDVKFNFDNLFNGNKLLSDETNKVLTENWRAVHEDLSPVFATTIDEVVKSIAVNTLEKFSFKEAFLP